MKKMLFSIAVLGVLMAASPVMAQRANPVPRAEYRYDNHDHPSHRGHGPNKHRHHAKKNHRGHGDKHWKDDRDGRRGQKAKHGRKNGHCRQGAPQRAPRRGYRG